MGRSAKKKRKNRKKPAQKQSAKKPVVAPSQKPSSPTPPEVEEKVKEAVCEDLPLYEQICQQGVQALADGNVQEAEAKEAEARELFHKHKKREASLPRGPVKDLAQAIRKFERSVDTAQRKRAVDLEEEAKALISRVKTVIEYKQIGRFEVCDSADLETGLKLLQSARQELHLYLADLGAADLEDLIERTRATRIKAAAKEFEKQLREKACKNSRQAHRMLERCELEGVDHEKLRSMIDNLQDVAREHQEQLAFQAKLKEAKKLLKEIFNAGKARAQMSKFEELRESNPSDLEWACQHVGRNDRTCPFHDMASLQRYLEGRIEIAKVTWERYAAIDWVMDAKDTPVIFVSRLVSVCLVFGDEIRNWIPGRTKFQEGTFSAETKEAVEAKVKAMRESDCGRCQQLASSIHGTMVGQEVYQPRYSHYVYDYGFDYEMFREDLITDQVSKPKLPCQVPSHETNDRPWKQWANDRRKARSR